MDPLESALMGIFKKAILEALQDLPTLSREPSAPPQECHQRQTILLRAKDAARLLSISERLLFQLTKEGTIPVVRLGKSVRYCRETLEQRVHQLEVNDGQANNQPSPRNGDGPPSEANPNLREARRVPRDLKTPSSTASRSAHQEQPFVTESRTSRNLIEHIADKLAIHPACLPRLTNGELMQIAQIDIPTLHGWQYKGRAIPEEAMQRLVDHFRELLPGTK